MEERTRDSLHRRRASVTPCAVEFNLDDVHLSRPLQERFNFQEQFLICDVEASFQHTVSLTPRDV